MNPVSFRQATRRMAGFSLIELMIALVLGLLVTVAAIGMFVSNGRTYRATESLGRVQENARVAFELMARDIREAGGTPCSRNVPVANVLRPTAPEDQWWRNWGNGIFGYDNGSLPGTLPGTDAIELTSGSSSGASVTQHQWQSAVIHVRPQQHGFLAGDVLLICDYRQASIFQMTGPAANPVMGGNIVHNTGGGHSPGNCSKGLGFAEPMNCSTLGTEYTYGNGASVVRLQAMRWFVADNGRGGSSLFRVVLRRNTVGAREEVIDGVSDLQVTYLLPGASQYVAASAVPAARWREVSSARLDMLLTGDENVGTDGSRITRRLQHTVTLRNRNP